ncbi:toxic anion resistance protein [Puia dinghuensis]|uniref:Tellurite resistance protein n=1 Tax=Puia dinghuensis TaxID=1792502 RepID=A0A8J2XRP1_9BACT|nr:toxic anion resistance protein [Puia dinghuensis]GGB03003.1 tellurite resistance protein [Puia dinghuensis]
MSDTNMPVPLSQGNANLDITKFTPEEMTRVETIRQQINLEDSQAIITYGVGAQREISTFADTILGEVRNKDSGYVGDIMTNLLTHIKKVDVNGLEIKGGFLSRIPILSSFFNSVKKFIAGYDKLSVQIEKITDQLDNARMGLLRDITLLDNMFVKNQDYRKNLEAYIAAGQLKIHELQTTTLPALRAKAGETKDALDAQRYNDFSQTLNRFEKKVYDLNLSHVISIQTGPQIRLIQNGNQALVEKIQSSILNTIPLWKNQMVIAITLLRQRNSLELQKEVTKTTNELLTKNSQLLKEGTIEIAKESESGIVEIETLKKVNNDLISTIEETLKIQAEGKIKRQQAETELVRLESDLKDKLLSLKS